MRDLGIIKTFDVGKCAFCGYDKDKKMHDFSKRKTARDDTAYDVYKCGRLTKEGVGNGKCKTS